MARSESAPFDLPMLPVQTPCSMDSLMPWLVKSRSELGELKGYSSVFSRKNELIHSFYLIDAVDSLALDGVLSTKSSVLESQLLNESEQASENKQALQIRKALIWGKEQITKGSINDANLKDLQTIVSGKKTEEFRSKASVLTKNVSTMPLNQFSDPKKIKELIENLLQFIKQEDSSFDPLVRAIMATAQFEAIRPFEDFSGRTARAFFQLLLMQTGLAKDPLLLYSQHIRKNTEAYARLFQEAVVNGNWCAYIKFMLHGIALQARETKEKLSGIESLYFQSLETIKHKCPQIYTPELVDALFLLPVISPLRLSSKLKIHYTTATRYLKKLEQEGFLENRQSGKYQLYSYKTLVQLL